MQDLVQLLSDNCRRNPLYTLLLAIFLFVLAQMVLLPLAFVLVPSWWGVNLTEGISLLQGVEQNAPGYQESFYLLSALNQLLTWGLIGWVLANLLGNPYQVLRLNTSVRIGDLFWAVVLMLLSIPLVSFLFIPEAAFWLPDFLREWQADMVLREAEIQGALERLFGASGGAYLLINLLVFALVPACCEEIFFRGILQQQLARRLSPHVAIWLAAAIFSFIHFQFLGFFSRWVLGALLGYFFWKSGSLFPSMVAHFAFNLLNILAVKFSWVGEARPHGLLVLLSFVIVSTLLFLYLRRRNKAQIPPFHE